MFRRFIGYSKEEKPDNDSKLDLIELQRYISKKYGNGKDFLKNFSNPLDIGKYRLALMVQTMICQKTKIVDVIDYVDLRKCLFIAYKINEFLEHPELYAEILDPIKSVFTNRKSEGKKALINTWREALIKEKEDKIVEEGNEKIVEFCSEREMIRLYRTMKQKFWHMTPPEELPAVLKTGSGVIFSYSELHPVLYNLYQSLPKAEEETQVSRLIIM